MCKSQTMEPNHPGVDVTISIQCMHLQIWSAPRPLFVQQHLHCGEYRRLLCAVPRTDKTNIQGTFRLDAGEQAGHCAVPSTRCRHGVKTFQYRLPLHLDIKKTFVFCYLPEFGKVQNHPITFRRGLVLQEHRSKTMANMWLTSKGLLASWSDDKIIKIETCLLQFFPR